MGRQVKVVHARDFIAAKPVNQLDLEESKRLLLEVSGFVNSDGAPPFDPCEILVDTRGSVSELSCADLCAFSDGQGSHAMAPRLPRAAPAIPLPPGKGAQA